MLWMIGGLLEIDTYFYADSISGFKLTHYRGISPPVSLAKECYVNYEALPTFVAEDKLVYSPV